MTRKTFIAAVIVTCGAALVYAQTKEPENGPELVKALYDKLGVECYVNRDGKIYMAYVDRDQADVRQAVDRLSKIDTLKILRLSSADVDQELLKDLSKLSKLKSLKLTRCKFGKKDLAALKGLSSLVDLELRYMPITDDELAYLKALKHLQRLRLDETKVTGSGFKHLESLPLTALNLTATPITDDSLKVLGQIHSLRELKLGQTDISDEGLMHLSELYQLISLNINGTQVTEAGRTAFIDAYSISRKNAKEEGLIPDGLPELEISPR